MNKLRILKKLRVLGHLIRLANTMSGIVVAVSRSSHMILRGIG